MIDYSIKDKKISADDYLFGNVGWRQFQHVIEKSYCESSAFSFFNIIFVDRSGHQEFNGRRGETTERRRSGLFYS